MSTSESDDNGSENSSITDIINNILAKDQKSEVSSQDPVVAKLDTTLGAHCNSVIT